MLSINSVSFSYFDNLVLDSISFNVVKGKNIAIIGESGCGKSTLLKLIYGIYDLDSGTISYNQKPILGPKFKLIPGEDYIKYLAQDFDLMPYITVAENVGKFLSNIYPEKKKQRINELLDIVEMSAFANVKAQYLSGGQQQRVALARVLALEPEILLLDEPFSQIDNFRKNGLRRKLFSYLKEKKITCLVATHDCTDALSFADEIIVLQNGKIVKKGNTIDVYNNPVNKYVASLFSEVNELKHSQFNLVDGEDETILLYPHQLKVDDKGTLKVQVKNSYFKGNNYLIESLFNGETIFFEHTTELEFNQMVLLKIK
ncbi:MAG TPA: ABC transporter ATP-binding protein [Flavobacterium sp.]|nr:ABC transporter ATP-binding protein [Flavobacterium sp.]